MTLKIYQTITETIGFAVKRYDTSARLGWLPLFLSLLLAYAVPYVFLSVANGFVVTTSDVPFYQAAESLPYLAGVPGALPNLILAGIGLYFVTTILQTSSLIPLLKLAARGEAVPHRSFAITFGWPHVKYTAASVVVIGAIASLTLLPLVASTFVIGMAVESAMATEFAVFPDENSLHNIEIVAGEPMWYAGPLADWVLPGLAAFGVGYLGLRAFAFPAMAALKERGETHSSFATAWRATRGWNLLRMFAIILILGLLMGLVFGALNYLIYPLMITVLGAGNDFANSVSEVAAFGEEASTWTAFFRWLAALLSILLNLLYLFFTHGITAGLNGSLYRQFEKV